jgi:predicted RNA binding protein YcfA (HicA-like mRNA interferase family)
LELERAGSINRGGKGSHKNYKHPKGTMVVTVSGKANDDAKQYQEKQVREALKEVEGK